MMIVYKSLKAARRRYYRILTNGSGGFSPPRKPGRQVTGNRGGFARDGDQPRARSGAG